MPAALAARTITVAARTMIRRTGMKEGGLGLEWACGRVEVILEDDRRGGSIEQRLAFPPVLFTNRQHRLRLMARQPLVLQYDRQRRRPAEAIDQGTHRRCLLVGLSGEAARQADH